MISGWSTPGSSAPFSIDINLTDGNSHVVAISLVESRSLSSTGTGGARPPRSKSRTRLGIFFDSIRPKVALALSVVTPVPANTDFQLSSASTSLGGTGLTAAVAHSNDGGATYAYTPVGGGGGGGAPSGYDRNVTDVRWTFTGALGFASPSNAGTTAMAVRIR